MEGALPSVIGGLVDRPVVAVPTSSKDALEKVRRLAPVDEAVSLVIGSEGGYAVARSYKDFHDMKDDEVLKLAKEAYAAAAK